MQHRLSSISGTEYICEGPGSEIVIVMERALEETTLFVSKRGAGPKESETFEVLSLTRRSK